MKTLSGYLALFFGTIAGLVVTQLSLAHAAGDSPLEKSPLRTFSSFDRPNPQAKEDPFPAGLIKFQDADVNEVFKVYQTISGRTLIRSSALPNVTITVDCQHRLTRREALQLLDTALAQTGITMIPQGATYVKAVPQAQAPSESAPIPDLGPDQLPESLSYMTYLVELKGMKPNTVVGALSPFSKVPNSVVILPDADLLILRDYSANVRRMLQVLERIERGQKARPGVGGAANQDPRPVPAP
jgi:type II secretory pathway component GspD/PulD (secretin)